MDQAGSKSNGIPEQIRSELWGRALLIECDTIDAEVVTGLIDEVVGNLDRFGSECGSPSVKEETGRRAGQLRYLIGDIIQRFDRIDKANRKIFGILREARAIPTP